MGAASCSQVQNGKAGKADEKVLSFVAGVNLFSYLEFDDHEAIAKCLEDQSFEDKEEVVHEGDEGHVMYIIIEGKAFVSKDSKTLAKLGAGDYFGEQALLWDQPRGASVTANGELKCLALTREKFSALELKSMLHFPKRVVLGGGDKSSSSGGKKGSKKQEKRSSTLIDPDKIEVSEEEIQLIADALGKNEKLAEAMEFPREILETMAKHCQVKNIKQGIAVIKQGDTEAEEMFIVKSGQLTVSIQAAATKDEEVKGKRGSVSHVAQLEEGASFGEMALLFNAPRAATITAVADCVVFSLHRGALKIALRSISEKNGKDIVAFLSTVQCLHGLNSADMKSAAEAFFVVKFEAGDEVARKGDEAKEFMILQNGDLLAGDAKRKSSKEVKEGRKSSKDAASAPLYSKVGELICCEEFFGQVPYKHTIVAGPLGATIYLIDRESYKSTLSSVESAIKEDCKLESNDASPKKGKRASFAADEGQRLKFPEADFKALNRSRMIGAGTFSVIWLVEQGSGAGCCAVGRGSNQMAMKMYSKGLITREKTQATMQNERKVLAAMNGSPVIIKLFGTCKDPEHVYLLLELASMDMVQAYSMNKLFGKPEVASYHIASYACALEALHIRKIAYRDVKPENLLIFPDGRAKLCDMGLSKFVPARTYSVVGTPEYCAPEVFSGEGYTFSCDWWSLGVLTFELMTGGNPFNKGQDILSTMAAVKKGFGSSHGKKDGIPVGLEKKNPNAVLLIKAVCEKKVSKRLPVGKRGQDELTAFKAHVWFTENGIDWEGISTGMSTTLCKPPFVPPEKAKRLKEPRHEDLPEEVPLGKELQCDWDDDF